MVIYICDDDFDENALNQAGDCFHPGLPKAIDKCGLRPVLMAWAMGMKVCFCVFSEVFKDLHLQNKGTERLHA